MEISSLERKLTTLIEDLQKSLTQLPSHHDLNIIEGDASKKIRELNSLIESLQKENVSTNKRIQDDHQLLVTQLESQLEKLDTKVADLESQIEQFILNSEAQLFQ